MPDVRIEKNDNEDVRTMVLGGYRCHTYGDFVRPVMWNYAKTIKSKTNDSCIMEVYYADSDI